MLTLLRLVQGFSVGGVDTGSHHLHGRAAPGCPPGILHQLRHLRNGIRLSIGLPDRRRDYREPLRGPPAFLGLATAFWCGILLGGDISRRRGLLAESPPGTGWRNPRSTPPDRADASPITGAPGADLGIASFIAVSYYMITVYLSTFLSSETHLPLPMALRINTLAMGVLIVLVPLTGALSDRWGRKPLMLASSLGFIFLSYPLHITEQRGPLGRPHGPIGLCCFDRPLRGNQ